jgi:hypothetical protein
MAEDRSRNQPEEQIGKTMDDDVVGIANEEFDDVDELEDDDSDEDIEEE